MSIDVGRGLIEVDQVAEVNVFGTGGDKYRFAADVSEVKRSLKSQLYRVELKCAGVGLSREKAEPTAIKSEQYAPHR